MAHHVAFLRAINLGAHRRFARAAVVDTTRQAGFTGVDAHLNTGNVRLETPMRSTARIAALLEAAYLAAVGFEVPCVVITTAELRRVGADAEALRAEFGPAGVSAQYVSFLKSEPDPARVRALEARSGAREAVVVRGRAAHLMLAGDDRSAKLTNATVERHLGVATNRNLNVVRALVEKWG